jgi:ABC-type uncharacterized transport system substrate-binding protein
MENLVMRQLALAALALGTAFSATPASAQTFSGAPVCLHVYGPATYYECSYYSMAQCNATASGRSGQCVANPYAASAGMQEAPIVKHRRYRAY